MKKTVLLIYICITGLLLNAQQPLCYWRFEGGDSLADEVSGKRINIKTYKSEIKRVKAIAGSGIQPVYPERLLVTHLFAAQPALGDFTLEFAFKGKQFMFTTFPKPDFRLTFSMGGINIYYTVLRDGKPSNEKWSIPLNGAGISSYNQLVGDGNWHHFVFVARKSGSFDIWIDGETDPLFATKVAAFEQWGVKGADGLRMQAAIDELAFYAEPLSVELIQQHAVELQEGKPYSFRVDGVKAAQRKMQPAREDYAFDEKEFAPGYPDYTIQATDQLKQFPLPRFAAGLPMPRNFSWMDITYLHRELPQNGGKGFGKINPETAVRLTDELTSNWNYYIELPTLRTDAASAQKRYTDPAQIFRSLIEYANNHPQLPAATVLMQVQNKPVDAGFDRQKPYITAQNLPDQYYLADQSGKPILYKNKKWISIFSATPIIEKDGLTSAFYLNQLSKHLTRKIELINENGEWFGHKWPADLLKKSPDLEAFRKKQGLDYEQLNGWMANAFDSIYTATIRANSSWKDVQFTFYNVSAYNSAYWPHYKERITTNSFFNGTPRSTPAFYPARPDNWRLASGPLNGYGTVAEGRKKEMELGVKFFAPFISPGWNLEEKNIRPGQWLGLLKSMVMLGADFFHVGYFNVTGKTGWPNGKGPNDPRGYIYQAAMPAYAQAMASQVWEFIDKGVLLEDLLSTEKRMPFAFAASAPNHLVLVRKWGNQYLIYGTVQPSSNYKGNAAIEAPTAIMLEGKKISFTIRRQGSMYVLDLSTPQPVFYQVDGWHQYEHPYYWSKQIEIEAENMEKLSGLNVMTDRGAAGKYDFTNFTTWVELLPGKAIQCIVPQNRLPSLGCSIILKPVGGNPELTIKTASGTVKKLIPPGKQVEILISSPELKTLQLKAGDTIVLSAGKDTVLLDKIRF